MPLSILSLIYKSKLGIFHCPNHDGASLLRTIKTLAAQFINGKLLFSYHLIPVLLDGSISVLLDPIQVARHSQIRARPVQFAAEAKSE